MTPGFYIGDCLDLLAQMPDKSVHCVVTSPPYYALRSYLPEDHPDKDKEIGSEPTLDVRAEAGKGTEGACAVTQAREMHYPEAGGAAMRTFIIALFVVLLLGACATPEDELLDDFCPSEYDSHTICVGGGEMWCCAREGTCGPGCYGGGCAPRVFGCEGCFCPEEET